MGTLTLGRGSVPAGALVKAVPVGLALERVESRERMPVPGSSARALIEVEGSVASAVADVFGAVSIVDAAIVVGRRYLCYFTAENLVTNPSFGVDAAGWPTSGGFVVGGSVVRDTAEKSSGAASLKVTTSGPDTGTLHTVAQAVVAGEQYRASFAVKGAVGGESIGTIFGAGVADFASAVVVATTAWVRRSIGWTVTAPAASLSLWLRQSGGVAGSYWLDDVLIHRGGVDLSYFDGDSAGYEWAGAAHASRSRLASSGLRYVHATAV